MFNFKKPMEGVSKQENFECECCGTMEEQASAGASGCASNCGPANNSCCGSMEDKVTAGSSGCSSGCGTAGVSCCGPTEEQASTDSGCCTQSNNSCCG